MPTVPLTTVLQNHQVFLLDPVYHYFAGHVCSVTFDTGYNTNKWLLW